MNDWRRALREGDPGEHAQLPADQAQAMRRAIVAVTAGRAPAAPRLWVQPLLVAATIALMIGTGVMAGRRAAVQEPPSPVHATTTESGEQEKRQLQFATPGGTRIIWVFNPDFHVSESTP